MQKTYMIDKNGTATANIKLMVRRKVVTVNEEPSMTKQCFKKECDINNILAKHDKTGLISHVNKHDGNYGDATAVDFHEAMNTITIAEQMFAELPSSTRKRFENDIPAFLDFVQNPDNAQEMVDMGLATTSAKVEVSHDAQAVVDAINAGQPAPAPEAQTAPQNTTGMK